MNLRRLAAFVAWGVTGLMCIAVLWTIVTFHFLDRMLAGQEVSPDAWATGIAAVWGLTGVTFAYATAGLVLGWRRGGGRVAGVLLAGGLSFGAVPFGYIVGGSMVLDSPDGALANAVFVLGPSMIPLGYALILPALALVFPHGRLPSARWAAPVALGAAALAMATLIRLVTPGEIAGTLSHNPFGWEGMLPELPATADVLSGLGLILLTLLGTAAVIVRYRRSAAIERHQLRWFAAAVLLAAFPTVMSPLSSGLAGPMWALAALAGLLLVPVSVGIAVTRYRLYEIDRLISRGLSWALLSAILVAVYAGAVLLLQAVLAGATQGQTLAVAASTLTAAALFQPLRRRIQQVVDRRFDRARYDMERTAAAFAGRLRDQVDLAGLETDIASTIRSALHPATTAVWVRAGSPGTRA